MKPARVTFVSFSWNIIPFRCTIVVLVVSLQQIILIDIHHRYKDFFITF